MRRASNNQILKIGWWPAKNSKHRASNDEDGGDKHHSKVEIEQGPRRWSEEQRATQHGAVACKVVRRTSMEQGARAAHCGAERRRPDLRNPNPRVRTQEMWPLVVSHDSRDTWWELNLFQVGAPPLRPDRNKRPLMCYCRTLALVVQIFGNKNKCIRKSANYISKMLEKVDLIIQPFMKFCTLFERSFVWNMKQRFTLKQNGNNIWLCINYSCAMSALKCHVCNTNSWKCCGKINLHSFFSLLLFRGKLGDMFIDFYL